MKVYKEEIFTLLSFALLKHLFLSSSIVEAQGEERKEWRGGGKGWRKVRRDVEELFTQVDSKDLDFHITFLLPSLPPLPFPTPQSEGTRGKEKGMEGREKKGGIKEGGR